MTDSATPTPEHEHLIRKLESIGTLSGVEKAAIRRLPFELRTFAPDSDLIREGDRPNACYFIVEGLACRYRGLRDGQRQILAFHMIGDMPDLQNLMLKVSDNSIGAITRVKAALVTHDDVNALIREQPGVGRLFWRDSLIDSGVSREWLVSVGRRSAYQRIAHLLCELFLRAKAIGLTDGDTMELPITQSELGDSLGLSAVHVNRVLQELRADGFIVSRGRTLVIKDWPGLEQAGDFDPTYLHLRKAA